VLLIPTFLMLGMTTSLLRLTASIAALHAIVVSGVLFEAFFTQDYANLFEVQAYYIATRSYEDTAFWNSGSHRSSAQPDRENASSLLSTFTASHRSFSSQFRLGTTL